MEGDIKNNKELNEYFDKLRNCTHKAFRGLFAYVGEKAVIKAREPHPKNWNDYTGNLRSSIGYIVTYNGKQIAGGGFEPTQSKVKDGGNGKQGQEEGKQVIMELKNRHAEGYALIVVAGMNYAEYVEANGRDVISGARLYAERKMSEYLSRLPELIEALMNKENTSVRNFLEKY